MLALLALLMLAHGDAEWIMREPGYRDAQGAHCCGPTDCAALPPGAVAETPDGYRIVATGELMRWGERGVYLSRDDRYWACTRGGITRCLFIPGRMG